MRSLIHFPLSFVHLPTHRAEMKKKRWHKNGIARSNQITDIQEFICTFSVMRMRFFFGFFLAFSVFFRPSTFFPHSQFQSILCCVFFLFAAIVCCCRAHNLPLFFGRNHRLKSQYKMVLLSWYLFHCAHRLMALSERVRVRVSKRFEIGVCVPISIWNWCLWNIRWGHHGDDNAFCCFCCCSLTASGRYWIDVQKLGIPYHFGTQTIQKSRTWNFHSFSLSFGSFFKFNFRFTQP